MGANVSSESESRNTPQNSGYDLNGLIQRRAQEIYERSGKIPGHDVENWMKAEQEIRSEAARRAGRRTAVVIKVNGIDYLGEYALAAGEDYSPGEFSAGDPVAVRFADDKMYVKRANGKELETTIMKTYK